MKKITPIFWLTVVFLLLFSTVNVSAYASVHKTGLENYNTENVIQIDDCVSLDLIFLIDQSGSMSGDDGNPNDPIGNRFEAPRYAMDWLANNRLGKCTSAIHRIGVISFGGSVVTDLHLNMTVINPATQADWDQQKTDLLARIQPHNLGTTDPFLAIKEAKKMLKDTPQEGSILRKTVIILLTDGQPCVESLGCTYGNDRMDHDAYMREMVSYVNENLAFSPALFKREDAIRKAIADYESINNIPDDVRNDLLVDNPVTDEDYASSVYFWVAAMNSNSQYLKNDGEYWKQITNSHGGELIDLPNNTVAVPDQFNAILSYLEGFTPISLGCGSLAIDPYLSGAVLDVYKPSNADEFLVEIKFDGKMIKKGLGDVEFFGLEQYSQFGAIEHYRFINPPSGLWEITALQCDGIEGAYTPFDPVVSYLSPNGSLPQYNQGGLNYDPNNPYQIEVQITDTSEQITLSPDPNAPLDLKALITGDDGSIVERSFAFVSDGVWATTEPLPVDKVGNFTVHLIGKAPCTFNENDPDRCPNGEILLVDDDQGAYSVVETMPAKIAILNPTDGAELPLHGPLLPDKLAELPFEIEIQLQDTAGQPLDWRAVLNSDPETAFTAVLSANGEDETITLSSNPQDPSKFSGTFSDLAVAGPQLITVNFDGEIQTDKYQLVEDSVPVNITRKDSIFRDIRFYNGLAALFGLLLVALIIKLIYDRTNVVLGKLEFVNESGTREFSINRHRRKTVITSGLPKELGLKKIIIRNDGELGGKRKIALQVFPLVGKEFPLYLVDMSAPQGIAGTWRVMYKWGKVTAMPRRYPTNPYHK